jgi:ELWxxDGT repeat protein
MRIWKSDGTAAGTVQINPQRDDNFPSGTLFHDFQIMNGVVYFLEGSYGTGIGYYNKLYKTNGTPEGTKYVDVYFENNSGGSRTTMRNINNKLYITDSPYQSGKPDSELSVSDGTLEGTKVLKNIVGSKGSYPYGLSGINGTLFYVAIQDKTPPHSYAVNGLWKTSSFPLSTSAITASFGNTYYPRYLLNINETLIISTYTGRALLKYDNPGMLTELRRDFNNAPTNLTNVNSTLYFTANDGTNGTELWKSDGTPTGTVLVSDIFSAVNSSAPSQLTNVNGTLFFKAQDTLGDYELWKSDGTEAGTVRVKDIFPGTTGSDLKYLTNVNGLLYFQARDPAGGAELWRSDGTSSGTYQLKDLYTGVFNSNPAQLTNVNGMLYFAAYTAQGRELWKSDGTTAGTVLVKDIYAGRGSSNPLELTNVNGQLYFQAATPAGGAELWKSNGTTAGTVQVKDIYAGLGGSHPQHLTAFDGVVYFSANDGSHGYELWKTNGTASGTSMIQDLAELGGSAPSELTVVVAHRHFLRR